MICRIKKCKELDKLILTAFEQHSREPANKVFTGEALIRSLALLDKATKQLPCDVSNHAAEMTYNGMR